MNPLSPSLQTIQTAGLNLQLFVPDPGSVRRHYEQHSTDFPYWSQIWPSAIGLCEFLDHHKELISHRTVLELAAGLGLPSIFAARYAKAVLMSDYLPEAVQLMQQTIDHHQLANLSAALLDWNNIPSFIKADTLLLSDVNYAPELFDTVYAVITRFLREGSTVILSTPQRLMAKPFIEKLLAFTIQQEEITVQKNGNQLPVSVLVLKS